MQKLDAIFGRLYAALDAEDLDGVQEAMSAALEAGASEDDVRLRYFEFMHAWLDDESSDEELEALTAETDDLLDNALELGDPEVATRIVLDVCDVLVTIGDHDEAELALRNLGERDDLEPEASREVQMLRAAILVDHLEDPDEALAVLDEVPSSLRHDSGYVALRASVMLELDRVDEAIELLEEALERDDDVELHYQLGVVLREAEREDEALVHLLLVRERDLAHHDVDPDLRVHDDEAEDLQRQLEEMLDTLPEPILAHVASAAIRVERWPSVEAVRAGCDPRTALAFEGTPAGEGEDEEAQLDAIVLYRDAIVAQIEDDEEIVELLALSLVEEADRFLDLELIAGM